MGFLYLQRAGAALHCSAWASHCSGVSCCGAQALGTWASVIAACWLSSCGMRALGCVSFSNCRMGSSVVVACGLSNCSSWALEHRLNKCGTQGWLLCGMWNLPGPRIKPMSLALADRFVSTVPPGKSPSGTTLESPADTQDTHSQPLWNTDDKPNQLCSLQQLLYILKPGGTFCSINGASFSRVSLLCTVNPCSCCPGFWWLLPPGVPFFIQWNF